MNAKERVQLAFAGERIIPPPVFLHSWGDYKVEFSGYHPKFQYYQGGEELTDIEENFYLRFKPNWMHLGSAAPRGYWRREKNVEKSKAFIKNSKSQWVEILDNYQLAEYDQAPEPNLPPLKLESISEIDDYFAARESSPEEIIASGRFDHASMLAEKFGGEVLIAVNDGAPGYGIPDHDFESSMIACSEKPDLAAHCIYKECRNFLPVIEAAKACGVEAYIFSEGLGGSLDMLSPELHERLELDTKAWFYTEVRKFGMIGIGYWLGDVRPNMGMINNLPMSALMIEESKKNFTLDPVEIRQSLREDVCLIGNLDSALLRHGRIDDILVEVNRQKRALEYGSFIPANGSPLVLGTPAVNIDVFISGASR